MKNSLTLLFVLTTMQAIANEIPAGEVSCEGTLFVSSNADSGPGSLRQSIEQVCDGGYILFDAAFKITLESPINIDKDLIIEGTGQVIENSSVRTIFDVSESAFLRIFKLTFENNVTTDGIFVNSGLLWINEAYFTNNSNNSDSGGGVLTNINDGAVTITKSSFYQNNAKQGSALHNISGGIYANNSTFYQNGHLLSEEGAAIYSLGHVVLRSVTMIDNGNSNTSSGNSVFLFGESAVMEIQNSIIASHYNAFSECATLDGAYVTEYLNSVNYLIDDGSCNATFKGSPQMGRWGNYGGFAPTIPLQQSSVLINAGSPFYCRYISFNEDQIGNYRSIGGECDLGAVEFIDPIFDNGFE